MPTTVWLGRDRELTPGAELFSSDRTFQVWDYTASHCRLLLRSPGDGDRTRIDLVFAEVSEMKLSAAYVGGLRIHCAAGSAGPDRRRFLLTAEGIADHVVAGAVGWHEDQDLGQPSHFADPAPTPPWARTDLQGGHGGFGTPLASVEELIHAVRTGGQPTADRTRYRYVYVLIARFDHEPGDPHGIGAFLTREEAEQRRRELHGRFRDATFTIDAVPVGI
ncbi:hypothetical protein [Crossiella sp. CA198]|uniref:hypothetical protein n=1 Tax=Crossiella sp. CA198 TaxID=3455607 RepID=UPI003F8D60A4